MPWKIEVSKDSSTRLVVRFTDIGSGFMREMSVDPATLDSTIHAMIPRLEALRDAPTGEYNPPAPPAPPVPSPEEVARETFQLDLIRLQRMHTAIALGLKSKTDADVVALASLLRDRLLATSSLIDVVDN